jgi:hypothetical protein
MIKRRRRTIRELRASYGRETEGEVGVEKPDGAGTDGVEKGTDQEMP